MKHIKNHIIRILTGWHAVETFGNPKGVFVRCIVCLKNGFIHEMNHSDIGNRWYSFLANDEHPDNPVIFWRKLPKRTMFFKIDE